MTRKKNAKQTSAVRQARLPLSTESKDSESALLEALRSNLSLLGEIAMRYEVNTTPERPDDPPSAGSPRDIHSLLGPEMSLPGTGAAAGAAARHQEQRHRPARGLPGAT